MKPRKLSKTACEKWMACPASFNYYYNERIRPIKTGSPLMFGSGIDSALNELLKPSGKQTPMDAYRAAVATYELGKVTYGSPKNPYSDFDYDLFTEERQTALLPALRKHGYKGDDVLGLFSTLKARQVNQEELTENQEKALDLIQRDVLEAKAELMLEAYRLRVLPFIKEVYNVQKQSGPGYLDATVEWDGRGKIILDNKTSGKRYPEDAVEYSAQLAMYSAEENIGLVAYVVLLKEINKNRIRKCTACGKVSENNRVKTCDVTVDEKRCGGEFEVTILPEAEIQIVHGEITEEARAVAAELQREVQRAVEAKIFPCNVAQCNSQFGKQCEYKNLKWKGSMEGLEVYKRKEKK